MATLVEPHFVSLQFPRDPILPPVLLPPFLPDASITELAPLASQHHTSEYNRLKFGLHGCPIKYFPLSTHLPEFFFQLQQRQARCAREMAWWHCNSTAISIPFPIILGSRGALPKDLGTSKLRQEIEAAMAEPLDNAPRWEQAQGVCDHIVKTSSTHPINISTMIPPELLSLISSHLFYNRPSSPSPTVFEIPWSFTLDRLLTPLSTHRPSQAVFCSSRLPPLQPQAIGKNLCTRARVTEAIQAAISGSISTVPKPNSTSISPDIPRSASTDILPSERVPKMKHSNASSISLTLSLTIADSNSIPSNRIPLKNPTPNYPTVCPNQVAAPRIAPTSEVVTEPTLNIGNLFLSSCPGKKVRLQGPVKGRSGVCRDLNTDLRRIKDLGVGCIICCLDNEELQYLGAPWVEYGELARANGIDVLRVPTPEGLAPLSPASLDAEMTKVINTYTLRGIPVLVHCRGGVGRAGVVACCWIIRLGLCGWVEADGNPLDSLDQETIPSEVSPWVTQPQVSVTKNKGSTPKPRKDIIQFVEKIIKVVRRRRSLKAIETYEQVQFLVEFVEYLRYKHDPRVV